ncbi:MAG: pyridoxamine 5'-phosphate oxidase family protein [Bacteroidales bacterium]
MRRADKEIVKKELVEKIIGEALVCRVAFCKNNQPYLVPLSFGYDGKCIYLHTAKEGKKIDYIETNNRVCFEMDINVKTIEHPSVACKWSTIYQSVIGFGRIYEIIESNEAAYALNKIMQKYSGKDWEFTDKMIATVRIWKIEIDEISGKQSNMD